MGSVMYNTLRFTFGATPTSLLLATNFPTCEKELFCFSTRDLKTCLKLTNKSELVTNNCQSGRFADVISTNDEILVLDGTDLIPSKVKDVSSPQKLGTAVVSCS